MKSETEIWQHAIKAAIKHLDTKHWPAKNNSADYDFIYKGKAYPPKQVLRYSFDFVEEQNPEIELPTINGGIPTNNFLKKYGFGVVRKQNHLPVENLIVKYKNLVCNGNPNEVYKWELIEKFKGRPDVKVIDFGKEFSEINFQNLIYHNGIAVFNHIVREKPEEYRTALAKLFDESIPLEDRVIAFQKEVGEIYKSLGVTLHHHHDERTIATLLAFHQPDQYALYKSSFYSKYCKLLGIAKEKKDGRYIHYLKLLKEFISDFIKNDAELLKLKKDFLTSNSYEDEQHLILAQDILYQTLDGEQIEEREAETNIETTQNEMKHPLNQILYGPPGTGKTYATIEKAIAIANSTFNLNQNRALVKQEYKRLCEANQIEFITFHQSLSYEDFVEGIKPTLDVDTNEQQNLSYELKDGIFKTLCRLARTPAEVKNTEKDVFKEAKFYKMSIGGKSRPDVHEYCIENNVIALGYGDQKNFDDFKKLKDWNQFRDEFYRRFPELVSDTKYPIQAMYIFQKMKIGDIVVITKGNHIIDAIGRITGEYFWDDSTGTDYSQFREVEWLAKNINQSPSLFFNKNISQQTIYEFYDADVKKEVFQQFFEVKPGKDRNYVLIIDEINRGNVSQIFGELITLLEEDKREGEAEALRVTLPYSKEPFSVPKNLYIIGTMNTADRSVEALDTALRRRFCFEEMLPNPLHEKIGDVGEVSLKEVLIVINKRLEKLMSRDHTIGHSVFIGVSTEKQLYSAFCDKIIPLLQEYFFGDYGKIGLVLGKAFVEEVSKEKDFSFADFEYEEQDLLLEKRVYRINKFKKDGGGFLEAVKAIYAKS